MNNKMAKIHVYQQLNLKSKLRKQENREKIADIERVLMASRSEGVMREWVKR